MSRPSDHGGELLVAKRSQLFARVGNLLDVEALVLDPLDSQSPDGGIALHAAASAVDGDHDLFLPDVSKFQHRQEHRE